MATEKITIEVQARSPSKSANTQARAKGLVPAVIYGPKIKNMNILAEERILKKYVGHHFDNTIFTLKSSDTEADGLQVLMKHKEINPVRRNLTHVDFFALDLTQTVIVSIELRFVGKARGIADGGLFQPIARDVEVECLPNKIPEFFEVDISDLGVHDSIHASDLKLPEGVELMAEPGVALCTVTIVKEEEASPVAAAAATAAEPEVIGKGKKEEGEAAAGEKKA